MMLRRLVRSRAGTRPMALLTPLTIYMLLFFGVPIGVFFAYSFWSVEGWNIVRHWSLTNYIQALSTPVYRRLFLRSVSIGLVSAALTVVVVYPLAYTMAFKLRKYRDLILFLLTVTLFSSFLVRIHAWRSVLSARGLVNASLMTLGLADEPTSYLLYSWKGLVVTFINIYIPFATLPIYSALLNIEGSLVEAARDLGASPLRAFYEVVLPLSATGVRTTLIYMFLATAGDFVTPELVGGTDGRIIGNAIAGQFGIAFNWPLGSALAFTTLAILFLCVGIVFAGGMLRQRR